MRMIDDDEVDLKGMKTKILHRNETQNTRSVGKLNMDLIAKCRPSFLTTDLGMTPE